MIREKTNYTEFLETQMLKKISKPNKKEGSVL